MKKNILIFSFLLLVTRFNIAQDGWFWQNPLPAGVPFKLS